MLHGSATVNYNSNGERNCIEQRSTPEPDWATLGQIGLVMWACAAHKHIFVPSARRCRFGTPPAREVKIDTQPGGDKNTLLGLPCTPPTPPVQEIGTIPRMKLEINEVFYPRLAYATLESSFRVGLQSPPPCLKYRARNL